MLTLLLFLSTALAEPPDRSSDHPVCPSSVDDLPLPAAIQRTDPRLAGKHLLVIRKEERQVMRFSGGTLLPTDDGSACWWGGLGYSADDSAKTGTKTRRGDMKTPEGWYHTSDKPWSSYYGAIAIHYPDGDDAKRGLERGLVDRATAQTIANLSATGRKPPQNTRLGGEILIHGGGGRSDWTLGCVGMDDLDIDALRDSLPDDMRIQVLVLP